MLQEDLGETQSVCQIYISDELGKVAWEAPLHLQEDFK